MSVVNDPPRRSRQRAKHYYHNTMVVCFSTHSERSLLGFKNCASPRRSKFDDLRTLLYHSLRVTVEEQPRVYERASDRE